jgi:hypothetical protein
VPIWLKTAMVNSHQAEHKPFTGGTPDSALLKRIMAGEK